MRVDLERVGTVIQKLVFGDPGRNQQMRLARPTQGFIGTLHEDSEMCRVEGGGGRGVEERHGATPDWLR